MKDFTFGRVFIHIIQSSAVARESSGIFVFRKEDFFVR